MVTPGISFCHGQEHKAEHHKHILIVSTTDEELLNILGQYFDLMSSQLEKFPTNRKLDTELGEYSYSFWILPPDYPHKSITRRLMRSTDLVILFYNASNSAKIEQWYDEFNRDIPILSLLENPLLLEEMNKFLGSITTPTSLISAITNQLFEE